MPRDLISLIHEATDCARDLVITLESIGNPAARALYAELVDGWQTIDSLPPGSLFQTKDGIVALKTEYRTFNKCTTPDCYLLESGEAAHFPGRGLEPVRRLALIDVKHGERDG